MPNKEMNTTASHAIADFIVRTEYIDIPAPIIQKAKECILDCVGVTLYGLRFEASRMARGMIEGIGGFGGRATVLGTEIRVPPFLAAIT